MEYTAVLRWDDPRSAHRPLRLPLHLTGRLRRRVLDEEADCGPDDTVS